MKLSGSSTNISIDTNSNSKNRTDGSDDHNKGLMKEEHEYLKYNKNNDSYTDRYG